MKAVHHTCDQYRRKDECCSALAQDEARMKLRCTRKRETIIPFTALKSKRRDGLSAPTDLGGDLCPALPPMQLW